MYMSVASKLFEVKVPNVVEGTYNEDELNYLFNSRDVIKKNMGELGDRMSLNAYKIYQMLKSKFKQT